MARLYTLEVFLIGGNVTDKFVKKNPIVSRVIQFGSWMNSSRST